MTPTRSSTEFLAAAPGVPLWIKPNAGVPRMVGDTVIYEADPAMLAEHVRRYADKGARIVGGCCGTTPEHIAAIAARSRHRLMPVQRLYQA